MGTPPPLRATSQGERGSSCPMGWMIQKGFERFYGNLIHRNRVTCFPRSSVNCVPLRSPFPSGEGFLARILTVYLSVRVRIFPLSVLLRHRSKGNHDKPCPAGEGGPQRKRILRRIREMIDAVAVDEVPMRTLFHVVKNQKTSGVCLACDRTPDAILLCYPKKGLSFAVSFMPKMTERGFLDLKMAEPATMTLAPAPVQ